MGGVPNRGTKRDKRLKENKKVVKKSTKGRKVK